MTRNRLSVSRLNGVRYGQSGRKLGRKSEEDVDASEEAHQTENDKPDRDVDMEEEIDGSEEKEDGHVEQHRYGLYGLRKTECLHVFEKVPPVRACLYSVGLGLSQVSLCPLLH